VRMARQHVIVRHLAAIEDFGQAEHSGGDIARNNGAVPPQGCGEGSHHWEGAWTITC
jgi:hypothetical protein